MKIQGNTVGTNMSVKRIAEKISVDTGDILEITIDNDSCMASHASEEILSAYKELKEIRGALYYTGVEQPVWLSLLSVDEDYAVFVKFEVDGSFQRYLVDADKMVCGPGIERYALESAIGDISSALDELHTYAQGLIEGGAEA